MNYLRKWMKLALSAGLGGCLVAGAADKLPTNVDDPARLGGEGATQESTLRDAGEAYTTVLREMREGVNAGAKIGGSQASLHFPLNLSQTLTLPLARWGIRPEEAELKLGRFYMDLRSVSASLLFSDNADRKEVNPESGVIGILEAEFTALLQLNDALQLGAAASIYYLPFSGEVGFGNPGGLLQFGAFSPAGDIRLSYTNLVKGWEVSSYDVFTVDYKDYDLVDGFVIFDRDALASQDRLGRYRYGDSTNNRTQLSQVGTDTYSYRNRAGITTSKLVPTETRVSVGVAHENYWNVDNTGQERLRDMDELFISLVSERENMRFRPHLNYRAYKRNEDTSFNHRVGGGVTSQLTEQIDFLGDFGYELRSGTKNNATGQDMAIWHLAIGHQINPSIYHDVHYGRRVTEPLAQLEESLGYRYQQTFGPYLSGELAAERRTTTDVDSLIPNERSEIRYGGRLNFVPSPRTTIRAGMVYSTREQSGGTTLTEDKITIRMDARYRFTDITELRFLYQFEDKATSQVGASYTENLMLIGMKRDF